MLPDVVKVWVAYPAGVLTQYFEIVNLNGAAQAGLTQLADGDLYYFRPIRAITSRQNGVSVMQADGTIHVDLPATTQAVNRGYLTAAYANANPAISASSLTRAEGGVVSVTAPAHGLAVGSQIEIVDAAGATTQPSVTAGHNSPPYTTSYSLGSIWPLLVASATQRRDHAAVKLKDGRVLIAGGYSDGATTYLSSCELFSILATSTIGGATQYVYDIPAAGALLVQRARHRMLLMSHPLLDSQVMLTGGYDGSAHAQVYLYTPTSGGAGSWAAAASMAAWAHLADASGSWPALVSIDRQPAHRPSPC